MKKVQKNHEVGTLLRLIAPGSVEVELVPLAAIEKAEFLFFWATIFLTVWGTVLGTWLSLVTVEHDNQPVRNLLLAVLFFLSVLVFAFTRSGFRVRSTTRQSARFNALRPRKLPIAERMDRFNSGLLDTLQPEFTEAEFKDLVNGVDDDDDDIALQTVLFDRMVASGAAVAIDGTSEPKKFRRANTGTTSAGANGA
jgi:hypothetical protein